MDIGQFIKKIKNERGELVYEDKIYGVVRTDSWDSSFNSSFETLFLKSHKEYLQSFNFHSKDELILSFGKYEPNVFRSKINLIVQLKKFYLKLDLNKMIK